MINYCNTHPEQFKSSQIPFMLGLLQATGGFIAECMNLLMLATRVNVSNCITFFVAFHVLTAIDNIYSESINDFNLRHACEHALVFNKRPSEIKFSERSCGHKLIRIIYKVLNFLYKGPYYYFTPFIINFIPYVCPGAEHIE